MITLKSCPVCKSSNLARYHRIAVSRNFIKYEIMPKVKVDAALVSFYNVCRNCRLIFQNPRFSKSELERFYSRGYYRKTHFLGTKQTDMNEKRRAKKDAEIIKEKIGPVDSHLDIGCSRGYLLKEVDAGVKIGVELNTGYVGVSGIRVYSKLSQISRKSFDLVTMIHLLEHVDDPLDYLITAAGLVHPKGFLVMEVPVAEDDIASIGLEHTYHFEPDVMEAMCKRIGLDVVHKEFTPHLLLICRNIKGK